MARIWDHVPVCLATIPRAMGYKSPAVPRQYWASGEAFALERNPAIVAALRELDRRRPRHRSRCTATRTRIFLTAGSSRPRPIRIDACATDLSYLRATLGADISIFVPPHNALSKAGMAAVSAAGLNLLGSFLSFHPSRRPFELADAAELVAGPAVPIAHRAKRGATP